AAAAELLYFATDEGVACSGVDAGEIGDLSVHRERSENGYYSAHGIGVRGSKRERSLRGHPSVAGSWMASDSSLTCKDQRAGRREGRLSSVAEASSAIPRE